MVHCTDNSPMATASPLLVQPDPFCTSVNTKLPGCISLRGVVARRVMMMMNAD